MISLKKSRRDLKPQAGTAGVTMSLKSFFTCIFVVAVLAQVVAIHAGASAAKALGSPIEPAEAVGAFLGKLLIYMVAALAVTLLIRVSMFLLTVKASEDSSPGQIFVLKIAMLLLTAGLWVAVAFFTRDIWQGAEFQAMLLLPVFYGFIGGLWALKVYKKSRGNKAPSVADGPRSAKSGASGNANREADTGGISTVSSMLASS